MPADPPALPHLTWLRAFEAAARHVSFTKAAQEIGVTQSAVSQQVRLLEAHLGQRLFERRPQRLELTDAGKAYLPAVQDGFRRIDAGTRELFGPPAAGRVTLRTTPGFAACWLAPRLPRLYRALPEVQLRMLTGVWDLEFEAGGADLEIRYGDGAWPGLHAERLLPERMLPVCHPDHAAELAADPRALARHRLLHTVGFRVTWPHWLDAAGLGDVVDGGLGDQFDTAALALQLAELGCGVALGRQSLVQDRVTAGRLAAPLAPALDTDEAFHLVHAADTAPSPPAARVAAWLRAAAEDGNLSVG